MACELFESRGQPSIASTPGRHIGFVHGRGHGIGLAVPEEPFFSPAPLNAALLKRGHVFTCEPGLYSPDPGYGVRKDVMAMDPGGTAPDLVDFPNELVIPIQESGRRVPRGSGYYRLALSCSAALRVIPGTAASSSRLAARMASSEPKCLRRAERRREPMPGTSSSCEVMVWRPRSWRW